MKLNFFVCLADSGGSGKHESDGLVMDEEEEEEDSRSSIGGGSSGGRGDTATDLSKSVPSKLITKLIKGESNGNGELTIMKGGRFSLTSIITNVITFKMNRIVKFISIKYVILKIKTNSSGNRLSFFTLYCTIHMCFENLTFC